MTTTFETPKEILIEQIYNLLPRKEKRELDRDLKKQIIDLIEDSNLFKKQKNFFLLTDFYKQTHWKQMPRGTTEICSYYENRSSPFPKQVFFGLSYIIQNYLAGKVVKQWMIDEAQTEINTEGGYEYFNIMGAQRILDVHNGHLPLEIKAVDEGTLVSTNNVLFTIRNTDPELPFLTNYVESILMHVYSTIGTATLSFYIRKLAEKYAKITGATIHPYFLNDFGFRGASSVETAEKNGGAHLIVFDGGDNSSAQQWLKEYYDAPNFMRSVFATEHSTTTVYGRDGEKEAVKNWLLNEVPDDATASFVGDSFNIWKFITNILGDDEIKHIILARKGKTVVRPDSGTPHIVALKCIELLAATFGFSINDNEFKVLNPKVGLIYGDGINYHSINLILKTLVEAGYCVSNIIFGMGGALLQQIHRDTNGTAIKCSHAIVNGKSVNVQKDPITSHSKKSKQGYLILTPSNPGNNFRTLSSADLPEAQFKGYVDVLKVVFLNGVQLIKPTYKEVKNKIEFYIEQEPAEYYPEIKEAA